MGGCASMPKGMRDEPSSAPPPEPSKDESVEAKEVIKPEHNQNDADEVDESKKQSLGSLLDEPEKTEGEEAEKPQVEVPAEAKKEEAEAEPKKEEEPKPEAKEGAKKEEPKN